MHRNDVSCAARISSNEKVRPSQSVNSPSWLPVRRRLPPGVKLSVMTGDEFLARVTWAMCVRYAVELMTLGSDEVGRVFRRRYDECGCVKKMSLARLDL